MPWLFAALHYCYIQQLLGIWCFPSVYKSALVKPLLKKMSLDPTDLQNYRPVPSLSFLPKVLERLVLSQLNEHLNHDNLLSPLQSAYRPSHNTKTALLSIVNDGLTAVDNKIIHSDTLRSLGSLRYNRSPDSPYSTSIHVWHFWLSSVLGFVLSL